MPSDNPVDKKNAKLRKMEEDFGDKLLSLGKEKIWDYRRALRALSDKQISDVNDAIRNGGYSVQERLEFAEYIYRKYFTKTGEESKKTESE